ncbi:hypothetical protein BABA_01230 [Neobacillus bataviensis LMG 21833]|uniref:Uncharacterized protein n=1 Tax=Neobacillus bataviensis LMG 21833 TaxID=1117379 RepID=K6EDH4_9BACI|nr:hypothetical protein [Neobacillus bataviensis]EKN71481.1 hypothetical protein BABA_01230 [Neobacillus bataviensis LMG 21833]
MNSEGKIVNYLEDKYGEKFVVEHKKEGSFLFPEMYGKDKLFVHPEKKPELLFEAGQSRSKEIHYYDGYISAIWGDELTKSLKDELEKQLPKGSIYRVFVNSSEDNARFKDQSFYDYIKNENNRLMVVLEVAIRTDGEPNVDEYSAGLYQALEVIKNLHTKYYTLSAGFVDKSEDKMTDYIRTSNVNNLPWSNLDAQVYGYLLVGERYNIQNPDDLMKNYKPVEE